MSDDGYTLVRIPGSDAIYRLPAGCPVTDENLRRFGERVSPPSGDVVSDPPDLVAWLPACYDRAEQKAMTEGIHTDSCMNDVRFPEECTCGLSAWRLADIARKRRILAKHDDQHDCGDPRSWEFPYVGCTTVRLLAEEFAGEPGYDAQRWAP